MLFASILLELARARGLRRGRSEQPAAGSARARGHDRSGRDSRASATGPTSRAVSKRSRTSRCGPASAATWSPSQFTEGARVAQGDLLFQIDPRPFEAEVARLTAERDRGARRAGARTVLSRVAPSGCSRRTRRRARSSSSSRPTRPSPKAKLAAAEAALDAAQLNLSFTRVTAPIAGRVSRAVVTAGNLVDGSTLLTTVVSDSPVYAYFDIDEQTYLEHVQRCRRARKAASVHVGLINEHGYPHAARLDFLDNQVDPDHGTIRARAVLDNATGNSRRACSCACKLVSPQQLSSRARRRSRDRHRLGRKFVFVVDEQNVVQYRSVVTGRSVEGLRVVKSGLDGGRRRHRQRLAARSPRRDGERDASRDGPRLARRALERLAAASNDNLPLAHNVR